METRIFNKVTKEVFLKYGFVKEGKIFALDLNDIVIAVKLVSWRTIKYFTYSFAIKGLNDPITPESALCGGANMAEFKLEHSPLVIGYKNHEIAYESWTEDYYRELLSKALHIHFDRYRENYRKHIEDTYWNMLLRKETENYLNLKWDPTSYNIYSVVVRYTKRLLIESTKEYTDVEKNIRPYRPEEIALEWYTYRVVIENAIRNEFVPFKEALISLKVCDNFIKALRDNADVFSYDAMLNSNFWKKQRALNTKVAEGLGII